MAKKHILIAEDDAFLRKMYSLNLPNQDLNVEMAVDGADAIAAIDKQQPDLLLLDLMMPKIDGMGVLKHINEKGYTFPVIILSNLSQEVDQKRCVEMGAKDFFVKSDMAMETLAEKVKTYL